MVDYENISGSNGLMGINYLLPSDSLHLFYSEFCKKIRREHIEAIEKSSCDFKITKLKNSRKNALDFYIATETGILFNSGEFEIAIITRDKGFLSIADYLNYTYSDRNFSIVIAPNIEEGIIALSSNKNSKRSNTIIEKSSTVDILEAYKNIKNNNKLRSDIETMLPHVTNSISSVEVIDFVHRTNGFSMKQIYTDSLHTFGRENGVRIYRFLKEVI